MNIIDKSFSFKEFSTLMDWHVWIVPTVFSVILIGISYYNYILFHTLAESFSIMVGVLMFVVAAYTHSLSKENFLMYLGIGYFWVAMLDMAHTYYTKA